MASRRVLVRSDQWWDHKVPPTIGLAAVVLSGRPEGAAAAELGRLGLLLVSMAGVASFGHVVNDWADIESDARGGKRNAIAGLAPMRRLAVVAATFGLGLVPWLWLLERPGALVALLAELSLLVLYSVRPVRLKARGWLGAVADAAYAYAVPFLIVVLLFRSGHAGSTWVPLSLVGGWGLLMGLRGILWHQIGDIDADRAAGVETAASRMGPSRTESVVASFLLPVELAAAAVLVVGFGPIWLRWVLLAFAVYRSFQMLFLWVPPLDLASLRDREARVAVVGFEFANEFVERWLALGAFVALAVRSPIWWVGVAACFVCFRNAARSFVTQDIWAIPDALERLAFSRGVRDDIRAVAARREARCVAGPSGGSSGSDRRFVFVVCGPASHLLTLRTAVHHLRPLTRCALWVVTDSRRNELVVDIEGVDRVVDVPTPDGLDDHQASIWLKTSLHRHLPAGEWCYLDSDVIGVVPGVEGVFDERQGPVAFASDLTIRENCVDRFSPWAMTCACLGYGAEHSCTHLREQLRERFELDVPGDWLHWNGGVFVFGPEGHEFLDMWHERAVASFAWPEWKTRDQGTLIATAWSCGFQDLSRISPTFNFIADLGNDDLCLDRELGWAHHPEGPWYDPRFLHLYTSPLEDPAWDLKDDVEAVVIRRSRVRIFRWRRGEAAARARRAAISARSTAHSARSAASAATLATAGRVADARSAIWCLCSDIRWAVQEPVERWILRARRLPRRFTLERIRRSARRRLGLDVSHLPPPEEREPEPQRAVDRVRR